MGAILYKDKVYGVGGSIIEGYYKSADGKFYEETTYETEIPGAEDLLYIDLTSKMQFIFDGTNFVNITDDVKPTVTEASSRTNIASGDTLKTIIGKIKKFFSDLKTVAFTGAYSDLSGTPTIPAAQVNSDWNASGTVAEILNKPTIPSAVAVKGNNESTYRTGNVNLTNENIGSTPYKGDLRTSIGDGTPAAATKTYWENNIATNSVETGYDSAGAEYTLLFSKGGSNNYGNILKWGYTDKYLRILRRNSNGWQENDWAKMDAGYADTAGVADLLDAPAITIKTGSTAGQNITLQTLMTWLIDTIKIIPSDTLCHKVFATTWSYAANDILLISAMNASGVATNYAIQLAGCIIEFSGWATDYTTGMFRLRIHHNPKPYFTPPSGYTIFPASHIAEYYCNGSSYDPVWKVFFEWGDPKPSYNFGEIGTGIATIGDGANLIKLRTTNTWHGGIYYHTTGDECMVFGSQNTRTSFMFVNNCDVNERPDWTGLSPTLHIKNGKVAINKRIPNNSNLTHELEVNGSALISGALTLESDLDANSIIIEGFVHWPLGNYEIEVGTVTLTANRAINYPNASGTISVSGSSSRRTKKNIENMTDAEAKKLLDLRPVKFDYITEADGTDCYGLIAEEVQDAGIEYPVFTHHDKRLDEDVPALEYSKFVPYLIKMVQLQQQEIDLLKQEVADLKNRI